MVQAATTKEQQGVIQSLLPSLNHRCRVNIMKDVTGKCIHFRMNKAGCNVEIKNARSVASYWLVPLLAIQLANMPVAISTHSGSPLEHATSMARIWVCLGRKHNFISYISEKKPLR